MHYQNTYMYMYMIIIWLIAAGFLAIIVPCNNYAVINHLICIHYVANGLVSIIPNIHFTAFQHPSLCEKYCNKISVCCAVSLTGCEIDDWILFNRLNGSNYTVTATEHFSYSFMYMYAVLILFTPF